MKQILFLLAGVSLLTACIKDESSEIWPSQNPNFSHITITSQLSELSVDYGFPLEFTPEVSQTLDKPLEYIWTANKILGANSYGEQIQCGEGPSLNYMFPEATTYRLRLEVKNEDYSEFKEWTVLNRAYDSGYVIVGYDKATSKYDVTFGRDLSEADILNGKEVEFSFDALANVNPSLDFSDIKYVVKSSHATASNYTAVPAATLNIYTAKRIYSADPVTFKVFFTNEMSDEFPGETIEAVGALDASNTKYLATSKGRILDFNHIQLQLSTDASMSGFSGMKCYVENMSYKSGKYNWYVTPVWVDEANSKVWTSVSYLGNVSNTMDSSLNDDVYPNTYEGYNIIKVFRNNGGNFNGVNLNWFAIAQNKTNSRMMKVVEFNATYAAAMTTVKENAYELDSDCTFNADCPFQPASVFNCVFYGNGSKLYQWYPTDGANFKFPSKAAIDLGEGKEITALGISREQDQIYVAFYDKSSSEQHKGGFYVYNTSDIGSVANAKPVEKYENVTNRPVQIFHKSIHWDCSLTLM